MSGLPLEGRVALVTGGSRGLGREMVRALARAGADVVITSRKQEACQKLAEEVTAETGRRAFAYGCHVGHWDELDGLVEATYERFGRLDVLVNNAGMSPLFGGLEAVSEELFDKVIGVNLKGPFRLTALAGARMKAAGSGVVINVSSVSAVRPVPAELPYSAAKAGLQSLTSGFAQSLGPEVRVNTLMAGPFLTDISKAWDMESFAAAARRYPLQRAGDPGEVVGAALFLATDASSFVSGALLSVDGGMSVARP